MYLSYFFKIAKEKQQFFGVLLFIIVFSGFFLFSFSTPASAEDNALIQCGRRGSATLCNICDLVQLAQSLINKILSYFIGPIAALMLGYGGFLMVLAGLQGGNASAFTKGKKVLTNTAWGIVLLFLSWLLIDTALKLLGAYQHASGSITFGPWYEIECVSSEITLPNEVGCNGDKCEPITGNSMAGCTVDSTRKNCGAGAEHLGCKDGTCQWIKGEGGGPNTCTEGNDAKCKVATSAAGGTCTGVPCSDSSIDTYKPDTSANCNTSNVNAWQSAITAGIKKAGDPTLNLKTEKLVKAIISQESGGDITAIGKNNDCGLMQIKPEDGKIFASACGTTEVAASNCNFYTNSANAAVSICIGTKMLGNFANNSDCGGGSGDIRKLSACYNGGSEAVRESANCGLVAGSGECTVSSEQTEKTRRWECLWDNNAHTECNAAKTDSNYSGTRKYVPKVWQCYTNF